MKAYCTHPCVCSHVCEGAYTPVCMRRPEINPGVFLYCFHLRFWSRASHCGWISIIQLDWLTSEPQGPSCLCSPVLGSQVYVPGLAFYMAIWNWTYSKHFTDGVMSLTPYSCPFVTNLFYLGCQNFLLSNTNGPLPMCVLFCLCSSLLTLGVPLSLNL